MAIPEYPITRREQHLDAIATNDTSVLPAEPITRTEQYLDAIARNGGGGGGSGGGVLVVHADSDTGALDKTWQEIADADCVVFPYEYNGFILYAQRVAVYPAAFGVLFNAIDTSGSSILPYQATSADGYPVQGG